MESSPTRRTAPLVTDLSVRDPVEPDQGRIPSRNTIEAAPRGDEHLRDRIVDEIGPNLRRQKARIGWK
jgi:hypothetical protein